MALAVSLNFDIEVADDMKLGLLLINIHLKNIEKSGVFIPEVWRFIIQCFEKMN